MDARRIYDTEHAQIVHVMLKPGGEDEEAGYPVDMVFYVLEGRGVVEIGGEKCEVGPDTLIDSPARIPHCWYSKGERHTSLSCYQSPLSKRTDETAVRNVLIRLCLEPNYSP